MAGLEHSLASSRGCVVWGLKKTQNSIFVILITSSCGAFTEIWFLENFNDFGDLTMGRGDKRTKRGKISMGSYGVIRPKAKKQKAKK